MNAIKHFKRSQPKTARNDNKKQKQNNQLQETPVFNTINKDFSETRCYLCEHKYYINITNNPKQQGYYWNNITKTVKKIQSSINKIQCNIYKNKVTQNRGYLRPSIHQTSNKKLKQNKANNLKQSLIQKYYCNCEGNKKENQDDRIDRRKSHVNNSIISNSQNRQLSFLTDLLQTSNNDRLHESRQLYLSDQIYSFVQSLPSIQRTSSVKQSSYESIAQSEYDGKKMTISGNQRGNNKKRQTIDRELQTNYKAHHNICLNTKINQNKRKFRYIRNKQNIIINTSTSQQQQEAIQVENQNLRQHQIDSQSQSDIKYKDLYLSSVEYIQKLQKIILKQQSTRINKQILTSKNKMSDYNRNNVQRKQKQYNQLQMQNDQLLLPYHQRRGKSKQVNISRKGQQYHTFMNKEQKSYIQELNMQQCTQQKANQSQVLQFDQKRNNIAQSYQQLEQNTHNQDQLDKNNISSINGQYKTANMDEISFLSISDPNIQPVQISQRFLNSSSKLNIKGETQNANYIRDYLLSHNKDVQSAKLQTCQIQYDNLKYTTLPCINVHNGQELKQKSSNQLYKQQKQNSYDPYQVSLLQQQKRLYHKIQFINNSQQQDNKYKKISKVANNSNVLLNDYQRESNEFEVANDLQCQKTRHDNENYNMQNERLNCALESKLQESNQNNTTFISKGSLIQYEEQQQLQNHNYNLVEDNIHQKYDGQWLTQFQQNNNALENHKQKAKLQTIKQTSSNQQQESKSSSFIINKHQIMEENQHQQIVPTNKSRQKSVRIQNVNVSRDNQNQQKENEESSIHTQSKFNNTYAESQLKRQLNLDSPIKMLYREEQQQQSKNYYQGQIDEQKQAKISHNMHDQSPASNEFQTSNQSRNSLNNINPSCTFSLQQISLIPNKPNQKSSQHNNNNNQNQNQKSSLQNQSNINFNKNVSNNDNSSKLNQGNKFIVKDNKDMLLMNNNNLLNNNNSLLACSLPLQGSSQLSLENELSHLRQQFDQWLSQYTMLSSSLYPAQQECKQVKTQQNKTQNIQMTQYNQIDQQNKLKLKQIQNIGNSKVSLHSAKLKKQKSKKQIRKNLTQIKNKLYQIANKIQQIQNKRQSSH